jgi:hypothetical protein
MSDSVILAVSTVIGTVVVILSFFRGRKTEAITEVAAIWAELDRQKERTEELEVKFKTVNDYAQLLRNALQRAGLEVPPWPTSMKDET